MIFTEEDIRKIIRSELDNIIKIDRYVFDKNIEISNAINIKLSTTTGTKIGTATTQKLGFYNKAPVVQAGAITAPSGGAVVDGESRTAINAIRTALTNLGLTR